MSPLALRTPSGTVVRHADRFYGVHGVEWDDLFVDPGARERVLDAVRGPGETAPPDRILAPVSRQEVWAAGVTYWRSRDARMAESKEAGGGSFYDRVYEADRPELFFKAMPHRVMAPGEAVRVRADSSWTVPEPELAVAMRADGSILGYTVGNDVTARDVEGVNPLYLPQAKMYEGSCALGPGILLAEHALLPETSIGIVIRRAGAHVFEGSTTLAQMRRTPADLAGWLFRELRFDFGCVLLTGTGIVPPDDFSLAPGDLVGISIEGIGTLENPVGS